MAPADRRNYKGIVDAVVRVAREEGVVGLWRGSSPTVARAMALNMAMLATADQAKEAFAPYLGGEKSTVNLVASSILSGVAASVASLPFDMVGFLLHPFLPAFGAHHTVHGMCASREPAIVHMQLLGNYTAWQRWSKHLSNNLPILFGVMQVKTRLQKQRRRADGTMPYAGFIDCAKQIAAQEGLSAFYKVRHILHLRISFASLWCAFACCWFCVSRANLGLAVRNCVIWDGYSSISRSWHMGMMVAALCNVLCAIALYANCRAYLLSLCALRLTSSSPSLCKTS